MTQVFDRGTLLLMAHALIRKPSFSHEDNARATALMNLAEKVGDGKRAIPQDGAESWALASYLRTGKPELRDLGVGAAGGIGNQSTLTSDLAHQGFYDRLIACLKAFDKLFDADVCSISETDTGAPIVLPTLDDTANAAAATAEGLQDSYEDPSVISSSVLPTPSTFRSGLVKVSNELVQDTGFPIADFIAQTFAIRLARGAGVALVTSLLSSALVALTAAGSSANSGGDETGGTSIGWADLSGLVASVNPAYRSLEKVFWLINSNTLLALDSVITKQGLPMIHPHYDAQGRRLLLGYPVAICPSMPDIGVGATPVAFGATGYFVNRIVKNATKVDVLSERFAEYGQTGYRAQMRSNGALLGATASDSPIKLLQNASE